jgi:hypothetical protein
MAVAVGCGLAGHEVLVLEDAPAVYTHITNPPPDPHEANSVANPDRRSWCWSTSCAQHDAYT